MTAKSTFFWTIGIAAVVGTLIANVVMAGVVKGVNAVRNSQ